MKTKILLAVVVLCSALALMANSLPIAKPMQWKIVCAGSAGTPTNILLPSGGSGIPIQVDSIYIAVDDDSTSRAIRVGGPDVTSDTGANIGNDATTARDGVGWSMDSRGGWCISEDSGTIEIDVLTGKS